MDFWLLQLLWLHKCIGSEFFSPPYRKKHNFSSCGVNTGLVSWKFQDLVVGYMGVPKYNGINMTHHPQYVTIRLVHFDLGSKFFYATDYFLPHMERGNFFALFFSHWNDRNERGREMLNLVKDLLEITSTTSSVIFWALSHTFCC